MNTNSEIAFDCIIKNLQDAINVCHNVDGSADEKSYPYATGYSRSAMQSTIEQLQSLKAQLR